MLLRFLFIRKDEKPNDINECGPKSDRLLGRSAPNGGSPAPPRSARSRSSSALTVHECHLYHRHPGLQGAAGLTIGPEFDRSWFRGLAPSAERTVESASPLRMLRIAPHDGGGLWRLPRPRFCAATKLTAPHTPRVPRLTLDQGALQAAALAFARGEIDRTELMWRIGR
jgi:hypothetical protein